MPIFRLTIRIGDHRTGASLARSFFRSPVTVGRREGNALRLDSSKVSTYHGAFAFDRTSLRYVDCGSRNGTIIDGTRITADIPVGVNEQSVIRIGPFEMTVHLDEISLENLDPLESETSNDPRRTRNGILAIAAILATYTERHTFQELIRRWPLSALLARALLVMEVFAEVIVGFRPEALVSDRSPLRAAQASEEVIGYLLDPSGGDESLEELLTYLVEMIHPGMRENSGERRS
jgi:pSer/pThr/pTyr-binding forkhead associated (FHA) protein